MKKYILILIACLSFGVAQAQLSDGNLYYAYTGLSTDTVSWSRPWSKTIIPNATFPLYYDALVKITEVAASAQTAVLWQGRKFDTDAWSTITTVNYKGTGADTSIYFTQVSTRQFYYQYRLLVTPTTTGKVKITYLKAYFRK